MKSVLEVNAIYFVLLLEAFGVLSLLLLIWIVIAVFRYRGKKRAITELTDSIRKRAEQRSSQTGAFLQAVYRLEASALQQALSDIEKKENEFFRLLITSLSHGKKSQITALDNAFDKLIASYKCLQPREDSDPQSETIDEVLNLRSENEQLKTELSIVRNKMSDMVSEFGNMFGGGKNHELALEEVKAKVTAIQSEAAVDIELETQK